MAAPREFGLPKSETIDKMDKSDSSAACTVSNYLTNMVNSRDLEEIIETQGSILERFEKSNETLARVVALSEVRYDAISNDFRKHIALLIEMKKDLDSIFKRIRNVKQTVRTKYPHAYEACEVTYVPPDDDDEKGDDDGNDQDGTAQTDAPPAH